MKRALYLSLLVFLAAAAPARANDVVSPPDRAEIHTSRPVVTFRWPAAAKAYYLEVYAAGQTVYSQPVATNHVTLTLKPEPPYQWRVKAYRGNAFQELVPMRRFTLSTDLRLTFSAAAGRDGEPGSAGGIGLAGGRGQPGGHGHQGPHLTATVTPDGDFVRIRVTGPQIDREVLLSTASDPLLVASNGGRGGQGGRGGDGGPGTSYAGSPGAYAPIVNGGNGGDGGDGGNGGNGGVVTVSGPAALVKQYLRVAAAGGAGGPGGEAGRGGVAGVVQASVTAFGIRGQDGRAGREGSAGQDGSVVYR